MGMNDNILEDYRNTVLNEILENQTITDVLSDDLDLETVDELRWKRLIPQQYVPDTITTTGSFIMFDIDKNIITRDKTYIELILYFWSVTHKGNPIYAGRLKNDILTTELENMFAPQSNLGISKNNIMYNRMFNTGSTNYIGRVMAFKITDWSDKVRNNAKNKI